MYISCISVTWAESQQQSLKFSNVLIFSGRIDGRKSTFFISRIQRVLDTRIELGWWWWRWYRQWWLLQNIHCRPSISLLATLLGTRIFCYNPTRTLLEVKKAYSFVPGNDTCLSVFTSLYVLLLFLSFTDIVSMKIRLIWWIHISLWYYVLWYNKIELW